MKRKGKIWFFLVAGLIILLAVTTITGVSTQYGDFNKPIVKSASQIRFGIDIRGGVDVSFTPADGTEGTADQMAAAQEVIEQRLIALSITDYEVYKDVGRSRIILRFPWKVGEVEFNPETAIQELAATAMLTFREGNESDATTGMPTGVTAETVILQGNDISNAGAKFGQVNSYEKEHYVELTLSPEGQVKFTEATTRIAAAGGSISIWMDNTLISAPRVNSAITDNTAIISGSFTADSAQSLANTINAGALPFALRAESYSTISPTLGSQSLRAMTIAGAIALILVMCFMIFNYRLPGAVASISLLGQTAATLAFISGYFVVFDSFTLTLPGIAGIILSIGIGVDANVINSERIKEELRSGKKLDNAIKTGFQHGLSPIIDSNVTVLIVAAILMGAFGPTDSFFATLFSPIFRWFGASTAGTIYSFGYTLLIGVALNFVFGLFCTRVMLTSISKLKAFRNPRLYGALPEGVEAVKSKPLNVVGNRKKTFAFSGIVMAIILVASITIGVQLDVQFKGGAIITYAYSSSVEIADAESVVAENLAGDATIQTGTNPATGENTLTITMPGSETVDVEKLEALTTALNEKFPSAKFVQLEVNNVDATIGNQFLFKCVVALLAASILILVYIAFRFRKIGGWKGGLTAIIALVHDLLVVYGVFVLLGIPLNGNFIAALLTILGYSINDTVVIYDRVRENRTLLPKRTPFADIVNTSINQSLGRSVNTTLTTLMALGCVCIFSLVYGLNSIFTFAFPMMIGMVSGVYSTIFLAGPLWVMWEKKGSKKSKPSDKKAAVSE